MASSIFTMRFGTISYKNSINEEHVKSLEQSQEFDKCSSNKGFKARAQEYYHTKNTLL